MFLKFNKEFPYKLIGDLQQKKLQEFPVILIWVHFTKNLHGKNFLQGNPLLSFPRKSFVFLSKEILCIFSLVILQGNPYSVVLTKSTFRLISKKIIIEGVFEFFHSDPQLDQNFKPTKNLLGQFFNIYLSIDWYIV